MKFKATIIGIALSLLAQNPSANAQGGPPSSAPILSQKATDAKPGDLRIMATAAIQTPLEGVRAQVEKSVGRPLFIEYGSARGNLKNEILAGQEFEVALLLPDVSKELLKEKKILPQSYEIARVQAALGLRTEGTPNIDVSTPAALKTTLLNAASVSYGATGAAHDTVDKILSTLGIENSIKDTSKLGPYKKVELMPGEYEIGIYPLSEIIANKNYKNLGPVIPELQVPAVIEAVVGIHANDKQAVDALIKFLRGSTIEPFLKQNGMEKGK